MKNFNKNIYYYKMIIISPFTNKKISIFTSEGKQLLKKYIKNYNLYSGKPTSTPINKECYPKKYCHRVQPLELIKNAKDLEEGVTILRRYAIISQRNLLGLMK